MANALTLNDIYQRALKAGLGDAGAKAAVAVAKTEGGLTGKVGDQSIGGSYGPFQFYTKGQLANYAKDKGLSLQSAGAYVQQNPADAVDWALNGYLGNAIQDGLQKGLTGPKLATYAQQNGQRSVSPERAGQNYQSLFSEGGTNMGTGSDPGGVDDTIYRMYTQAQAEKAKSSAELKQKLVRVGQLKGALGMEAGVMGFDKATPDYAAAMAEYTQAQGELAALVKQDDANTQTINRLQQDYITARNKNLTDSRNADIKAGTAYLNGQKDYLAEAVAQGKINTDQARLAWDEAQQTSDNWTNALSQAYTQAGNLAPKMSSQEDMDSLWSAIQKVGNGSRHGDVITGSAPKVIQLSSILDPYMKEVSKYIPPPDSVDWTKAMSVPEGLGTPTISRDDYIAGAMGQIEHPAPLKDINSPAPVTPSAPMGSTEPNAFAPAMPEAPTGGYGGNLDAVLAGLGGADTTGPSDETVQPLPGMAPAAGVQPASAPEPSGMTVGIAPRPDAGWGAGGGSGPSSSMPTPISQRPGPAMNPQTGQAGSTPGGASPLVDLNIDPTLARLWAQQHPGEPGPPPNWRP